jgi:hypothetical protein
VRSYFEVYEILQKRGRIPSLSVAYNDESEDTSGKLQEARSNEVLSKCRHHGEIGHISDSSLANIPSDVTQVEKYLQDAQFHEGFACGTIFRFAENEEKLSAIDNERQLSIDLEATHLSSRLLKAKHNSRRRWTFRRHRFRRRMEGAETIKSSQGVNQGEKGKG